MAPDYTSQFQEVNRINRCKCDNYDILDRAYKMLKGSTGTSTKNNSHSTHTRQDFEENSRRAYARTPRGPESHFKWKWESAQLEESHYLHHLKNYCYILLILGVACDYPIRRATKNLGVLYYVKKDFYTSKPKILQVEEAAENEYVSRFRTELLYSLEKRSDYPIKRVTKNLKVLYYVKKYFDAFLSIVRTIEKAVENEEVLWWAKWE